MEKKINKLKEKIVKKFGSVKAFAYHEEQTLSPHTITKTLLNKRKRNVTLVLSQIEEAYNTLTLEEGGLITKAERTRIKNKIRVKYGTFTAFTKNHPVFPDYWLHSVLSGKAKKKNPLFVDLLNVIDRL